MKLVSGYEWERDIASIIDRGLPDGVEGIQIGYRLRNYILIEDGEVMLQITEETVETTVTKEKFQISHPGGHVFYEDRPTAHWDDNGIRFRVFKESVIEAISSALLQDDPLRIRVKGKMHTNNAINMKDMEVESWMLV